MSLVIDALPAPPWLLSASLPDEVCSMRGILTTALRSAAASGFDRGSCTFRVALPVTSSATSISYFHRPR